MDIPLPDDIPLPHGTEDTNESQETSNNPAEESANESKNLAQESNNLAQESNNSAQESNLENADIQKNVPSNPITIQTNLSVAPPNQPVSQPNHHFSKPPPGLGMLPVGGLPNLNQPPPSLPNFSKPPPGFGFPPLNQPPPGMSPFSQPPPSILHQLRRPPPPPVLKSIINESETASTQERYSPTRVTVDDDEPPVVKAVESLQGQTVDTQTVNATDKKVNKIAPKVRPSLLGKIGAKKRLMAFSGKTSFNISKTSKVTAGSVLEENDEAKKSVAVVKKKKKEKKSMIEYIRDEETRIKEAIGLKQFNLPFSLYGPGLFPIQKLLDNPEELRKFEEKAKGMPDRLAAYEQKEKKRQEDKDRDKEKERQREKDKRKERESGRSKDGENEKAKNVDKRNDEDSKRKPKFIPKNWKEFKDNNITFEDIQHIFREKQDNRSRDHRNKTFVNDIEAKLLNPLRVKSQNRGLMEIPGRMICNTNTKPHLTYSINPSRYSAHFLTRYELKHHKSLESWTLLKEFWNSVSNHSIVYSSETEGIDSRQWYEKSWNIESICARADLRADAQDVKNREQTDIDMKSRWDSDNEVEENASKNEEKYKKSGDATKKESSKDKIIEYRNVKEGQFSDGLNDEYDLFLKSLDDEDKMLEKRSIKEKKVEDDSKDENFHKKSTEESKIENNINDDENQDDDICNKLTDETIRKDKDSDVSDSVEPNNELNIKKKKNKKLKKQKDIEKKKKKEEKKAKKKAKKAKKKLKKQKENIKDSRSEKTSDNESQENEECTIKRSPATRNTTGYDENSGSCYGDDDNYNDDSWSKYHQEKLTGSPDLRYANSVCKNENNSPYINEHREFYEDQLDNDEKHISTRSRRPNKEYYKDECIPSREDKLGKSYEEQFSKRNFNPLTYGKSLIKKEYPQSLSVSDYDSDEFEHEYSKEKFSDSQDSHWNMHKNVDDLGKHNISNYDQEITKESERKHSLSDSQKEYKEISNKLERYNSEDDYDRKYKKDNKQRNDLEGKSYAEKESRYSRYDYELRKDEIDYRNKEKVIHKDSGGYNSDSENDDKYNNSYNKHISNRNVRKSSEYSDFRQSTKYDKISDKEFDKSDRSNKDFVERKSEYMSEVDQIPMPSNTPQNDIPFPSKASEDSKGISHQNYRSRKESGSYRAVNEVQELTDKLNKKTDSHKKQIRNVNSPIAFKLAGSKYSGQQYKTHPGFAVEAEQDNDSYVSNNDLEDEDSDKEDHVVGSLADTLRALRQIGSGTSVKDIEKNKDRNHYKSKQYTTEDSYQCEDDSLKWKEKNHYQKEFSPGAKQQHGYERLHSGRSEEDHHRYQSHSSRERSHSSRERSHSSRERSHSSKERSHSSRERSPRSSSLRSSQIRKKMSPRRSPSLTQEVSPTEKSKYSDRNHPYNKSPDHENYYEEHGSKYYDDTRKSQKYNFEDSHHHGEHNEFVRPEDSSYESYSTRKEKYSIERERSPAFKDVRQKHMSPDYSSRGRYGRDYDREKSPNLEKNRHKHSYSRENLSKDGSLNMGYYSLEEDDKIGHFKQSRNIISERKESQYNSGYSYTTAEFESTSESKSLERKGPNTCFESDFKEKERYKSRNEENPNRDERKWYNEGPSSHDREFYRSDGDENIDRKESYRSRPDYLSPEPASDRSLSPNRRYRERSGEIYSSSDKMEREIIKVIKRSPSRREVDQRSRSTDREKRELANYSNTDHSKRILKEQYNERIDKRDDNGSYDHYMASPNRTDRFYAEKRNQEKDSYSYNRAGDRSPEINNLENKQSNSLQLESKQRTYSPESYSHIRKHSYNEYSSSPNTYEYVRSQSPSSSSGSIQAELQTLSNESKVESSRSQWSNRILKELPRESSSPSREESSSHKSISTTINSRSSTSRSKSPPTNIKSTAKRSISPRQNSLSPKALRSPRINSEMSSKSSRSPTRTSKIYSPSRPQSPNRRISQSPHTNTMQSRSPHSQPESPSRHAILSSTSSRMSISPQRRLSRSPHRSSRSPQRRISRSPQKRLSESPQQMSRSPCRKSMSPSNSSLQSHHRISSPQRRLSRSPQRRVSRSPQIILSRSPERRLSRSPPRILKSPQRRPSNSPPRKLSRSTNKISSPSPERGLSRSPLRKHSESPKQALRSPNLSPRSPLEIGELTSIASINISRDYCNIKLPDDIKQTLRNITKIPEPDGQYESNSTNENTKIPLPDDHGSHGANEETKIPLADDKERQGSKEFTKIPLPIIHDKPEAAKQSLNDANWTWDQEKKCWLPNSSEDVNTSTHNENESKFSCEKISLSEPTVKIDADSTISDSELTGHQESPVTRESSSSPPHESPRRLTLDERLMQEHGVTVQEEKPINPAMNQLLKWGYPVQSSQVIQVGNMIEILPRSLIEQVTNSTKIIPTKSGEILASASSSSDTLSGLIGQQQNTVTSTANVSVPTNLALINSSVDETITSEALVALSVLNKEIVQKYSEIDPQIQANSVLLNTDVNIIAKEQLKLKRRELKERRRQEREARREKRRLKAIEVACREAIAAVASEQHQKGFADDAEEEALIREAMFETPNLGSPVPDYEVIDEEEEEKEEEARARRQKRLQPVPLPAITDKGILMSPSYRARDDYQSKSVKFADGVLPGEGTSPSGGEEIHSPPPPTFQKTNEKKLRKKRRVKIKMIKQYGVGPDEDFSPPPPPPGDPVFSIKLFPGFDHHYKATASGAAMIYTQPVLNPGLGGVISVPGVPMVGFSRIGDAVLFGSEGISSPSVIMSPGGPIVPSPVKFQLPTGFAYNAESLQFIQTASTQPTASTLVDTNLSKSN